MDYYIGQLVEARVVFQPEKRTAEASQQNLLQPQETKKDEWVDAIVIGVHEEAKTIDVVVVNAKTVGVLPLAFQVKSDDTRFSRKIIVIKLPEELKTIEEAKNTPEIKPEGEQVEVDIEVEFEEDKKSEGGDDLSETTTEEAEEVPIEETVEVKEEVVEQKSEEKQEEVTEEKQEQEVETTKEVAAEVVEEVKEEVVEEEAKPVEETKEISEEKAVEEVETKPEEEKKEEAVEAPAEVEKKEEAVEVPAEEETKEEAVEVVEEVKEEVTEKKPEELEAAPRGVAIFNRRSYLPRVTPKLTQNATKRPHQHKRGRSASPTLVFASPFTTFCVAF